MEPNLMLIKVTVVTGNAPTTVGDMWEEHTHPTSLPVTMQGSELKAN